MTATPVIPDAKGVRQQCAVCELTVIFDRVSQMWVHSGSLHPDCPEVTGDRYA